MFLEPFGLLSTMPLLPDWIKLFVPAYKATRIIAEVAMEALPQSMLQAYIYIVVISKTKDGSAPPNIQAMVEFASLLPKSILISTLATLKTWVELVEGARQAGLTVVAKAVQLWNVGAGLPLDALKKGAIVDWTCPYELAPPEISPLIDALGRNASLVNLDLSPSGMGWDGPGSTGEPLINMMAKFPAALSGLRTMTICAQSRYAIPVGQLRSGGVNALSTLRAKRFFTSGGPRRKEVLFMGDLMRHNRDPNVVDRSEEVTGDAVARFLTHAGMGKIKREAWDVSIA